MCIYIYIYIHTYIHIHILGAAHNRQQGVGTEAEPQSRHSLTPLLEYVGENQKSSGPIAIAIAIATAILLLLLLLLIIIIIITKVEDVKKLHGGGLPILEAATGCRLRK